MSSSKKSKKNALDAPNLPDEDEWKNRGSRFPPMSQEEIDIHHARHEEMNRKHDEAGGKWTYRINHKTGERVRSRRVFDIEMTKAFQLPGEYWVDGMCVAAERLIDDKWVWVGEADIQGNFETYTKEQLKRMYPRTRDGDSDEQKETAGG